MYFSELDLTTQIGIVYAIGVVIVALLISLLSPALPTSTGNMSETRLSIVVFWPLFLLKAIATILMKLINY